jgi:integrase/recombinase XerD
MRGQPQAPKLFVNALEQPMTRAGFEYILRKHVTVVAAQCPSLMTKRISPHVLRHMVAIVIMHATGDMQGLPVARTYGYPND